MNIKKGKYENMNIYKEAKNIRYNLTVFVMAFTGILFTPVFILISLCSLTSTHMQILEYFELTLRSLSLLVLAVILSPVFAVEFIVNKFKSNSSNTNKADMSKDKAAREYKNTKMHAIKNTSNVKGLEASSLESYEERIDQIVHELTTTDFRYDNIQDWDSTTSFSAPTYADVLKRNL